MQGNKSLEYYTKLFSILNCLISSSTVCIPAIPKLSINILVTLGDKNAGNVGPDGYL